MYLRRLGSPTMSIDSIGNKAGFTMTVDARKDAAKAVEAGRDLQASNGKVIAKYQVQERENFVDARDKSHAAHVQKVADERRSDGQKEADAMRERYQEDARRAEEAVVVGRLVNSVG